MLKWNDVLMDYVVQPNAMFAIRNGNTARKFEYDKLRRGFLTKTSEGYSFFYTDNFHAAYYLKMAMDGFVPSVDEMVSAYNSRKFPARFGIDTSNERELMAIGKGKNPGIQNAGYKIAHIFSVNEGYYKSNHSFGGKDIIDKYFPIGERSDWKYTGELYLRDLIVKPEAREYLVAQFMRFVHPFNYFLTPKKTCCSTSVCKDIAEYGPLIEYVRCRYADMYGKAYEDYLDMIMVDKKPTTSADGKSIIDLSYGLDAEQKRPIIRKTKIETALKNKSDESIKNGTDHADHSSIDIFKTKAMELQIIMEYLVNPKTSFRKLEKQFMNIDSKSNGGGFKAKGIINAYGIDAGKKGILSTVSIDEAILYYL